MINIFNIYLWFCFHFSYLQSTEIKIPFFWFYLLNVGFNLKPFEFDVALIEVNQSAQISRDNPLEIADEIIFTKTAKHLNNTEQLLIQGTLANQTYEQIAASAEYSVRHLKNVAIKLWEVLSEVVGEKVTKKNLKTVLERLAAGRHLTINRHRQQSQCFVEELANGVGLKMVSIPEGSFMMGAAKTEEESDNDQRPQHQVTVSTFFMGKYPVTQEEWEAVAALPQINRELDLDLSNFKGVNRPVETVSWYDAVEFCDRLSQYTKKSYRLPSEAEWEYVCRAGTTTPFNFGETITSELANYNANYTYGAGVKRTYRRETTPVGSFEVANAFGLYDMHGNVWEWCLDDWHRSYEGAPTDGSAWFDSENNNISQKQGNAVLRGGSWVDNPVFCRSAYRNYSSRDDRLNSFGFRIVCAIRE
ncbi:MAG: formylglycine-generating enzyme family protein [Nostoc sp.]